MRERVRERSFWVIQAGVLLVTAAHWGAEVVTGDREHGDLLGALAFVPVILYVVPVAYAALRYGFEGGLLTGLWAALLAVPNMVVVHRHGFEWVGELLLIMLIVSLGAVVALPVERERLHRIRAEQATTTAAAASQRLALLSETAALATSTEELYRELRSVLQHLIEILDVSSAAVVHTTIEGPPVVEVCSGPSNHIHRALHRLPQARGHPQGLLRLNDAAAAMPLETGSGADRFLIVAGPVLSEMSQRDEELLETIAIQVGAALETVRLQREQQYRWRLYLRQATRAQEDERRRLARDLHDVAIHDLLLLRRRLGGAAEHPAVPDDLTVLLAEIRHGLGTVTEQLRRFCGALRPSVLSHLGLPPALEWLTGEFDHRTRARAEFEVAGAVRRLPDDDGLALFRIAEEALRNVERHAEASSVMLRLEFRPAEVCLEVTDDGVGFTVPDSLEDLAQHSRLGLLGMRERAELAGGHLRISSEPARGTRIFVQLPDTDLLAAGAGASGTSPVVGAIGL